ncbi:serine/threonine-protein phosphatase [Streptomyces thinghirensis]|nr:serine/threonine-protein phosphatase [Streptomyces thinghirensis]
MFRKRPAPDGEELLARLASLTTQARELAELRRSQVELAVAAATRHASREPAPRSPASPVACYSPAYAGLNVGGDWYDAFVLPDDRIGLSVGDVRGHAIDAAAFMGQIRVGLRALASVTSEPGDLLACTNDLLLSLNKDLFATCTFMRFDPATGVLETRAGRAHPLRMGHGRRQGGGLRGRRGPPLGVLKGTEYPVTRYRLTTGGVLVLLTDGVVEGPSLSVDEGLARVVRLAGVAAVAGMEAHSLAAAVLKNAELVGHEDDAAVLVVGHDGRAVTP